MAAPRSSAQALDLLETAAALAPDRWPIRRRHLEAIEKSGQREETIRRLRMELAAEPFRAETWSWLGDLLTQARKTEESLAAFQRATELDVHDNESRERIGIIRRIQRQQQATESP